MLARQMIAFLALNRAELHHSAADHHRQPFPHVPGVQACPFRDVGNANRPWRSVHGRFDAYCPWNVGNYVVDATGAKHASTGYWEADKRTSEGLGVLWIPVVYPGFSWDNLQRQKPGASLIARRGGRFLWEQFHELSRLGVDTVYVAMFDEVDEGTAIFKVTSAPPTPGHFVGYEGLPSDWYLRLVGEAASRLRQGQPVPEEIPLRPPAVVPGRDASQAR